MKNLSVFFSILLFFGVSGYCQVITVTPALPNDKDAIEVIFDASQGSGGLAGYTGNMYAHTGVITNKSTSGSDWKYVKADWGVNIADCKLTSLGNNKWKLNIGPSIREYYSVPTGEEIQKLAFVFRNPDGSKTGKTSSGGDIFYDVFPSSLSIKITAPSDKFLFVDLNSTINVTVSSLQADSTLLFVNGSRVAFTTGSSLAYTLTASAQGRTLVKAIGKSAAGMVADSFYYYVRPEPVIAEIPAGMKDGINYLSPTSVLLSLYAPLKHSAFVIGDFNNWLPDEAFFMKKTPDGKRYWLQIDNLTAGKEYIYQYLVDDNIRIGDPYATKVSDPWNDSYITNDTYPNLIAYPSGKTQGIATVLQTSQKSYQWKINNFAPPKETDLVIYELLVRDFSDKHTFQAVIDNLGYLWKLGVNAIELMPVSEFEGNLSWGYNPNFYFAVDKYYGTHDRLKQLIDTCHQLGIAVISDIVLNHSFGTSPYVMLYWDASNSRPSAESPIYNPIPKHDFNVGFDMNHESPDVKNYVGRILRYWLTEFKFDGYRFDLSKGFTQKNTLGNPGAMANYDQSRVDILSAYYDTIVKVNPKANLILEHFADNSEEKVLAEKGMLLWGNMNNSYIQAAKGNIPGSDLSGAAYTSSSRGWSTPNLVSYMESHDEERQMYSCLTGGLSSGSYSIKDSATALNRAALAATFFYTIPGPKMLWQFGERGYDYSINWPSGTSASRLDSKPPRWDYMNNAKRFNLYSQVASLIKLHKENPVFETTDFDLSVSTAMKRIRLRNDSTGIVVLGNFDLMTNAMNPKFYNTGKWYELFTGDSITVTNTEELVFLKAGEYRIYSNKKLKYPYAVEQTPANNSQVIMLPNPFTENCLIKIFSETKLPCEAKIYDQQGKCISEIFRGEIFGKQELQWHSDSPGIYFLKVRLGNQNLVRKIIVSGK